jgi:sugar lactone lactonase YvrE
VVAAAAAAALALMAGLVAATGLPAAGPAFAATVEIDTVVGARLVLAFPPTLAGPRTAAVDDHGDIYVTDTDNNLIRRVDAAGRVSTIAGTGLAGFSGDGGLATAARLWRPHGIAVDNRGHVFVADSPNHRIRRIDLATGIITTVAGTGTGGYNGDGVPATRAHLNRPRFLLVAPDQSLIIADTDNRRVRRVSPAGVISTIAGTGVAGFGGDGGPATAARLDDPRGLALDSDGTLYVSNAEGTMVPSVRRIDPSGVITTVAGGNPAGFSGDGGPARAARLDEPRSIALLGRSLYIADSLNDRVRRVDLDTGVIDTVAGTGVAGYGGDGGPAIDARLAEPRGVAVMGNDVLVVDTGNNRIRRITGLAPDPGPGPGPDPGPDPDPDPGPGPDPDPAPAPGPAPGPGPPPGGPTGPAGSTGALLTPVAGYRVVTSDGSVFTFGGVPFAGSAAGNGLQRPVVGTAASPSGAGYWLVASDGGLFAFGDARFFGSAGGMVLNRPIVGMAASPSGAGYWLVASDGGLFAFGDARFFGSAGGMVLNRPIVGMAASPTGGGYWLTSADGGIFSFGDAPFLGAPRTPPGAVVAGFTAG